MVKDHSACRRRACQNRPVPTARRTNSTGRAAKPGRSTPRKRDDDVLRAAEKVFHERGYSAATVQDIADELGILKGSLYHYIDTKEDLLFRLMESVHLDVQALMVEIKAVEGLSAIERLHLFVRRQVTYNLANLPRIAVYYHDMDRLSEERAKVVAGWRRANSRYVSDLIKEAQATGEADPDVDAAMLTNFFFSPVIWTYRWYRQGGRLGREATAEACADFVVSGLAAHRGLAGTVATS
jgi:AcrR family transcriptional regulator